MRKPRPLRCPRERLGRFLHRCLTLQSARAGDRYERMTDSSSAGAIDTNAVQVPADGRARGSSSRAGVEVSLSMLPRGIASSIKTAFI
jgi:hypothetical protein